MNNSFSTLIKKNCSYNHLKNFSSLQETDLETPSSPLSWIFDQFLRGINNKNGPKNFVFLKKKRRSFKIITIMFISESIYSKKQLICLWLEMTYVVAFIMRKKSIVSCQIWWSLFNLFVIFFGTRFTMNDIALLTYAITSSIPFPKNVRKDRLHAKTQGQRSQSEMEP